MFRAIRVLFSTAKSGAAGRAGSPSRPLSASSDSRRLAGKVAVITGAASGIGKVTAAEFVRKGAKVVLADVQDSLGRAVAAELGDPDTACYTRCEVTDKAQVAAAVDLAVARHGRLDVMFNNAGITGGNYAGTAIESLDLADFDRVMAVNLRGVAAGIKHAARAMVPRGAGCILCTSSTAGALGGSGPHAYSVSILQDGRRRHGAFRGGGAGGARREGERHLAVRHRDAHGGALREGDAGPSTGGRRRRGVDQAAVRRGHQRDGRRRGAARGGRCEGGGVPGVRRGQVHHRA
ncbi:hypothetical protein ACQJBY_062718 [Aegilops geniculata]